MQVPTNVGRFAITVVRNEGKCPRVGVEDYFYIKGDKVHAPFKQGICFYSLSAMMPFFVPLEMEEGSNDHYILGFKEFSCPMGNVTYRAERVNSVSLDEEQMGTAD